ncbi:winged helix-turn-helix domain-containing protein, partial [Mycobacterium tuberculosis]|nr:winged helix-turn-helix domain-containing protein [Mycobacterium tuberculosis]
MVPMTENERRILSELSRAAPLSKRDVTLRCGMGWATAVKLMTRLEEQGLIAPVG